ncbi:protein-tyrosine phosphatase-like protein [Infundibulicybe gibba]|nr:protein-tyrosine phosphatase-like protein [Infundibulicybe gibba]
MLSFPAQRWKTAIDTVRPPTKSLPGYGKAASLIVPRVYLSDAFIYAPGIPDMIPDTHRLHIRLADRAEENILSHLETTTNFINSALAENENNKVLVHCFQGISRSATVVCAYVIASTGMPAPEAIAFVQEKRGIVCPNLGFRHQLETYAVQFEGIRVKREGTFARISKMVGLGTKT